MRASSVFVLTALTVTGVYVKNSNRAERENYVVDFETLEQSSAELAENMVSGEELDTLFADIGTDDLDYDPSFQEANSLHVENAENTGTGSQKKKSSTGSDRTGQDDVKTISEAIEESKKEEDKQREEQSKKDDPVKKSDAKKKSNGSEEEQEEAGMFDETVDTVMSGDVQTEGISTSVQPELAFGEEDNLVWPIVGDVLINYSMDQTIYFPTLDQYKYNPAIVIAATQGESIGAAANGRVNSVSYDPATGNTVVMELVNGY